jgi:hypothetical protein
VSVAENGRGRKCVNARVLALLVSVAVGCQVLLIGQASPAADTRDASVEVDTSPSWGYPALIETEEVGDALFPSLDLNDAGNGVAVWIQTPEPYGPVHSVWANRYSTSSGWAGPEQISSTDNLDCSNARAAVDPEGNILVVWTSFGDGAFSIWSIRYSVGAGWGTPVMIDPNPTVSTILADVAFDGNGNAFAFWLEYGSVKSSRYVDGIGWGPKESVSTHWGYAQPASFGVDSQGNAIAVWYDQTDINSAMNRVWCNRYVVGVGWGMDELLMSASGLSDPSVVVDETGNAVALWRVAKSDAAFSPRDIWTSRYTVGTGWSSPEMIEETTGYPWSVKLAGDGSGNCIAVWEDLDTITSTFTLWTKKYSPLNGWSPKVEVGTSGYSPAIDINHDGLAVLIWLEWTQGVVLSSRCTPQTDWTQPELVGTYGNQDLCIAVDAGGNAIAAWMMWEDRSNILGNSYGGTPEVISATVSVNPETVNLASKSKWITVYIELPDGFDVSSINVDSIRLNGQFPATGPSDIVDYDKDKVKELMVKFDLQKMFRSGSLEASQTFTVTITGLMAQGMMFEGSDTVTLLSTHSS